jgi:hypothetical protein
MLGMGWHASFVELVRQFGFFCLRYILTRVPSLADYTRSHSHAGQTGTCKITGSQVLFTSLHEEQGEIRGIKCAITPSCSDISHIPELSVAI